MKTSARIREWIEWFQDEADHVFFPDREPRVRVRRAAESEALTAAPPPPPRKVVVADVEANAAVRPRFCHNGLTTYKYSLLSFLPKFLYEQFSRSANLFFLFVALLQQVPGVSPLDPVTTVMPLLVVLTFTAVKEIYEDVKRHRADYAVNHRLVQRLQSEAGFEEVEWVNVRVGDIVRVETDQFFPADLVLLASSEPDGICYVETANLDGETNLKVKQSLPETAEMITHELVAGLRGAVVLCEHPNNSLYTFEGTLEQPDKPKLPLGPNQLLLRGAQLRNCRWAFGAVVFTGKDSKLARNSQKAPTKRSMVERITNRQIAYMFIVLAGLAIFSSLSGIIWSVIELKWSPINFIFYLNESTPYAEGFFDEFFMQFMTFVILFQNLIPISLIVTMEMVKFILGVLINSDVEIYHAASDTPTRVRTSNLIEELGQVQYVFSDKTGTLTENKMEFQKASIAGKRFALRIGGAASSSETPTASGTPAAPDASTATLKSGPSASASAAASTFRLLTSRKNTAARKPLLERGREEDDAMPTMDERDDGGVGPSTSVIEMQPMAGANGQPDAAHEASDGHAAQKSNRMVKLTEQPADLVQDDGPPVDQSELLFGDITTLCQGGPGDSDVDVETLREFCTMMAVCHTVVPEFDAKAPNGIRYQASSPDEAALVKGAAALGYAFMVRRPRAVTVRVFDQEIEFTILAVLEFNSTRKRMSVVVRTAAGRLVLYTKGADTVIMERLGPVQRYARETMAHLEAFAVTGLRTLCFGMRELGEEEYAKWKVEYDAAAAALTDRDDQLMSVAELLEKNLVLLGATAVEDKLQQGVPETIELLAEANIKLWVLTGDRQETAINIGHSCRLLNEDMSLIVCNEDSAAETKKFLENRLAAVNEMILNHGQTEKSFALIIDGQSLTYALKPEISDLFVQLGRRCRSVICCRVSPLQKALVVRLVKNKLDKITLAIGDGANDVGMILAAHIGVGISGEEGLQAARSADFAIAQFRFLQRLLLVHGSWSLHRLSKLILYCFYKNIALYMIQFWFAFANGFSGQIAFEQWTISLYNVLFTALAPLSLGIFDQFLSARSLLLFPELYKAGQQGRVFSARLFWVWTLEAMAQSLVIFITAVILFRGDLILAGGVTGGLWWMSTFMYTLVVITVALKAALITDSWTVWSAIAILGSVAFWFLYVILYDYASPYIGYGDVVYGITVVIFPSPTFWFALVVIPIVCVARRFISEYYQRTERPTPQVIVQEIERYFPEEEHHIKRQEFRAQIQENRIVRLSQRTRRNRGYAFSQNESGQWDIMQKYDTTRQKPAGL